MSENKNNTPFVEVKNLVVHYTSEGKEIHAVNDVSFKIEKGETLGLVGETGAGKTTIANSILRILPEPPAHVDNGEILLEGKNLLTLYNEDMRKIRGKRISVIFQDPMTALNPVMRIGEQISEGIVLHEKISQKKAEEKTKKMLEMVGIPASRYHEYPHQFSGGQRQRIGIARALALRPDFVVCDEPVSALDVSVQAQVVNLLKDLQQQFGLTYMFISHDLRVVRHIADRVAVMYLGKIVEYGEKRRVYSNPAHPYTRLLMSAVPLPEPGRKRHIVTVGEIETQGIANSGCRFASRCPHVMPICRDVVPPLAETDIDHSAACHLVNKPLGAAE